MFLAVNLALLRQKRESKVRNGPLNRDSNSDLCDAPIELSAIVMWVDGEPVDDGY